MAQTWLLRHRFLVLTLLLLVPLIALACGEEATPVPQATAVPEATATTAPQPTATRAVVAATPTMLPTFTPVPVATPAAAMITAPWFKEGKRGGVIPMQNGTEEAHLDPHTASGTAHTISSLFSQVLRWDHIQTDQLIGDLAKSWQGSPDGLSYTFVLHDAKWSDGKPITAADVKFSLDRMVEPQNPRPRVKAIGPYYKSSEVLDPKTLKVNLRFPQAPAFFQYLALPYMKILPKHILEQYPVEADRVKFLDNPGNLNTVASGPFRNRSWLPGNFYEHERNPNYFKEGLPFLDGIRSFLILDLNRLTAAYKTEQVLMSAYADLNLTIRDLQVFEQEVKDKVKIHWLKSTAFDGIIVNHTKPPFDNPKVRRAVYLGIDRLDFINTLQAGQAVAGTPFPPETWMSPSQDVISTWPGFRYVDKDGKPLVNYYGVAGAVKDPRDIAEAKKLLEEAGYKGEPFVFQTFNFPYHKSVATLAEQQLKKIGLNIELRLVDAPTNLAAIAEGKYQMDFIWHGMNIMDSDEPFNIIYTAGGGKNAQNWDNPRINDVFKLSAAEADPGRRQKLIWEAGEIMRQGESHWIPLTWRRNYYAVNFKVKNFFPAQTFQQGNHHEAIWLDEPSKYK